MTKTTYVQTDEERARLRGMQSGIPGYSASRLYNVYAGIRADGGNETDGRKEIVRIANGQGCNVRDIAGFLTSVCEIYASVLPKTSRLQKTKNVPASVSPVTKTTRGRGMSPLIPDDPAYTQMEREKESIVRQERARNEPPAKTTRTKTKNSASPVPVSPSPRSDDMESIIARGLILIEDEGMSVLTDKMREERLSALILRREDSIHTIRTSRAIARAINAEFNLRTGQTSHTQERENMDKHAHLAFPIGSSVRNATNHRAIVTGYSAMGDVTMCKIKIAGRRAYNVLPTTLTMDSGISPDDDAHADDSAEMDTPPMIATTKTTKTTKTTTPATKTTTRKNSASVPVPPAPPVKIVTKTTKTTRAQSSQSPVTSPVRRGTKNSAQSPVPVPASVPTTKTTKNGTTNPASPSPSPVVIPSGYTSVPGKTYVIETKTGRQIPIAALQKIARDAESAKIAKNAERATKKIARENATPRVPGSSVNAGTILSIIADYAGENPTTEFIIEKMGDVPSPESTDRMRATIRTLRRAGFVLMYGWDVDADTKNPARTYRLTTDGRARLNAMRKNGDVSSVPVSPVVTKTKTTRAKNPPASVPVPVPVTKTRRAQSVPVPVPAKTKTGRASR